MSDGTIQQEEIDTEPRFSHVSVHQWWC